MDVQDALIRTLHFLISENRNSDLPIEERQKIQNRKRYGKILGFLYPFGFIGGMFYCLSAFWKEETIITFRGMVIEDHANRVIKKSLERTWGKDYKKDLIRVSPSKIKVFASLWKNFFLLRSAYRLAGIEHVTEFVRIFRLFHFYIMWKGLFSYYSPSAIFLARTNDQKRLALGSVAEEYGIPLNVFTVDQIALRSPAPFAVSAQFCFTKRQVMAARERNITAVRMPVPSIRTMKLPVPEPGQGVYGLLLNAKCYPSKVGEWVENFSTQYNINSLQVRPHPGFDVEKLSVIPNSCICDWHQPLGEYLDGLDLVFALNTNAVIEALLHGVPVVYLGGFDPYEYDLHRFVANGIACPYLPSDTFPESVSSFFSSESFRVKWNPGEFITDNTEESDLLTQLTGAENDNIAKT